MNAITKLSVIAVLLIVLNYTQATAQSVGINTTMPDASAILDITHTTRGLLIPRVQLTASNVAAPIIAPALSLLVFNLLPAGIAPNDVKTGYYYWDGAKWVCIGGAPPLTTNTLNTSGNTITSTVDGVVDTTQAITSVSNTSTANNLTTIVNGIVGAAVPIINNNTVSNTGNNIITSNINGVIDTTITITAVSNTLTGTNLTSTVNGVVGAPINLSGIIPATTNTISTSSNTITSTVDGVVDTTQAVTSVSNTSTANNLTTTINGVVGIPVTMVNSLANTYNSTTGEFNTNVNGVSGLNITLPTNKAMGDSVRSLAWLTKGNAGTTAGTNFIGTIDAQDLTIKTNNSLKIKIGATGGVGIGGSFFSPPSNNLVVEAGNFGNVFGTINSSIATYWGSGIIIKGITGTNNTYGAGYFTTNSLLQPLMGIYTQVDNTGTGVKTLFSSTQNPTTGLNVPALTIASNNNIGIGTTIPTVPLTVIGNSGSDMLKIQNNTNTGYSTIQFFDNTGAFQAFMGYGNAGVPAPINGHAYWGTTPTSNADLIFNPKNLERMRFTNTGNLGIATPTPLARLHVLNDVTVNGAEQPILLLEENGSNTNNGSSIQFKNNGAGYNSAIAALDDGGNDGRLEFRTSNDNAITSTPLTTTDTKMTIVQNGNVGIGTDKPNLKLHLHDATQNFHALRFTSGISQANYWDLVKRGDAYLAGQNHNLVFSYNGTTHMSIAPTTGNVGLGGVEAPTEKLDIAGSIKITDGSEATGRVLTSDATGKVHGRRQVHFHFA